MSAPTIAPHLQVFLMLNPNLPNTQKFLLLYTYTHTTPTQYKYPWDWHLGANPRIVVPFPDKSTRLVTIASKKNILHRHNGPRVIVTGNRVEFDNQLLEEFWLYWIQVTITAHRSESSVLVELLNHKFPDCLYTDLNPQHDDWDQCISNEQCALSSSSVLGRYSILCHSWFW